MGLGHSVPPILGVPFHLCLHSLTQNKRINVRGNMWEWLVFMGNVTPRPKGAYPNAPQFWGPLYLCLQPLTQNDQIRCGEVSHALHRKVFPEHPNFWGSSLLMHTKFDLEPSSSVGEGRVLGDQSR